MKATGIITEYNPFHNGHKYHIQKTRELTNPDVVIAVMSGNYTLRGELSIVDKYEKTRTALLNGVDLVLELPYIALSQNAYTFAQSAVDILKKAGVTSLVFGSETNNLEELKKFAELEIDVTHLKELMRQGNSYPKAYGLLAGSLYPNDILAVAYLRALKDSDITPYTIQRTNDYHSLSLDQIASATALRQAIRENRDVSKLMPETIKEPVFTSDLYPYLRKILLIRSREQLREIFLVSEGIEKVLKDNAYKYSSYEDFISHCVSKRYTRSRIQRICMQILLDVSYKEVAALEKENPIYVLGFNAKGQEYLKELKEKEVNYISQLKQMPPNAKNLAFKAGCLYATMKKDPDSYLKRELQGPVIIK